MITTKEGIIKKRGERVWEIGYCITQKRYRPTLSKIGSGMGVASDKCWSSYDNCLIASDKMNINKVVEKRKNICKKILE